MLGVNAIPLLGISKTKSNGEALLAADNKDAKVARIELVKSVTLPSQKGHVLEVKMIGRATTGRDLLFQPTEVVLSRLGLWVEESLL